MGEHLTDHGLRLVTDEDSPVPTVDRRKVTEAALEELNPEALFMDGLDDAIVGIGCQYSKTPVVVYSEERIIDSLMFVEGMTYEEAWEWYSFNIACAYVGEYTPIIIQSVTELERYQL